MEFLPKARQHEGLQVIVVPSACVLRGMLRVTSTLVLQKCCEAGAGVQDVHVSLCMM